MRRSLWDNIDYVSIFIWICLVSIGLIAIYSVTHSPTAIFLKPTEQMNFYRQLGWVGVCAIAFVVVNILPVRYYMAMAYPVYGFTLLLLIAALLFGTEVNGATSWLSIGPIRIQSAEFAKIGALLVMAHWFSQGQTGKFDFKHTLLGIGLILLPALLIVLQNDTGTALVFTALIPVVLFWSGIPLPWMTLLLAPAVIGYLTIVYRPFAIVVAILVILGLYFKTKNKWFTLAAIGISIVMIFGLNYALDNVLQPHQKGRIAAFADPESFRLDEGFHIIQARAAIGSGGLFGKGFMNGTQIQMGMIPENSTDFVFCVIGEEFGFIGAFIVLVLFSILIVRLMLGAMKTTHPFAHFFAAGASGIYFFHIFVNIGMTISLMPVIGIPLPFISYGGSALLANTVILAIALNFQMRAHEFPAHGL